MLEYFLQVPPPPTLLDSHVLKPSTRNHHRRPFDIRVSVESICYRNKYKYRPQCSNGYGRFTMQEWKYYITKMFRSPTCAVLLMHISQIPTSRIWEMSARKRGREKKKEIGRKRGSRNRRALILGWVYYLDAFSGYPFRTWLPAFTMGTITSTPEEHPFKFIWLLNTRRLFISCKKS